MEESSLGGKGDITKTAFSEMTPVETHFFPFIIGFDPIQE